MSYAPFTLVTTETSMGLHSDFNFSCFWLSYEFLMYYLAENSKQMWSGLISKLRSLSQRGGKRKWNPWRLAFPAKFIKYYQDCQACIRLYLFVAFYQLDFTHFTLGSLLMHILFFSIHFSRAVCVCWRLSNCPASLGVAHEASEPTHLPFYPHLLPIPSCWWK